MRRSLLLPVTFTLAIACEPPPPLAPDTTWAQTEGTAFELPPLHVSPCFATALAKKNNPVRAAGVIIAPADVQACADQMKSSGEAMAGGMSFMVALGADQHVSAVDVVESCGVPAAAMLCLAQTFRHARIDPETQPRAGLLRMSFDPAPRGARGASSSVGYTSLQDFTVRANDTLDRVGPKLDTCARSAFSRARYASTRAVFSFKLAPSGKVTGVNLDPFEGDQALLSCADEAFQTTAFPPPPRGAETVRMPVIFEPAP